MTINWDPIRASARKVAEQLGHDLGGFSGRPSTPQVRTAICLRCYGCCWVCHTPSKGFRAGGRLLKYRCGTTEAAGLLRGGLGGVTE